MGVIETAIVALALFGALTTASTITGAVMGSKRNIGSARGFLLGMLLPVVGIGLVALSKKKQPKEGPEQITNEKNQAKGQDKTTSKQPQKKQSKHHRQSESLKLVGKYAAREQFQKKQPQAVKRKKQSRQSQSNQQVQTQSQEKGMRR